MFFINIPIGVLSLLLTSALVYDPVYMVRKSIRDGLRIDYIGFGLLALGLGSLEVVLDEGQKEDWFSSGFIVVFAIVTVVCLISVVLWELRQKEPVIDFRILKERNFTLATLTMLILGVVLYGSTTLLPLMLQTLMGYTSMLAGMVLSPGGIVIVICMPIVGMLLRKVEARWLVIFGVVVSAYSLFMMAGFNLDLDYRTAVWSRLVQSLGLAFLFVPISTTAFRLHRARAHQLRRGAVQPGAEHRRQHGDRHGDHHALAACAVPPGPPGLAPDAARPRLPRLAGGGHPGADGARRVSRGRRRAGAGHDLRKPVAAVQHAGVSGCLLVDGRAVFWR